jgi:pimeloyl-ACP methyl ester carboxylesterase
VRASTDWLLASGVEFDAGQARTGCAQLKHYTAAYKEWGDGPPLVLVPGLAGGVDLFGPLARRLARSFRVISYQLRGEDDCFALRRRFGMQDLVSDLAEFLDWHCLERPAVLGVSFGGILALEFAARFPHRLRALALQGVGAAFERSLIQRIAGLVLSRYPLPSDNSFVNQFFNLLFGSRPPSVPLFDFVTRCCWQTDQSVMSHRFHLVERFNMLGRLQRIPVPALVMAAERDVLVSRNSVQELCEGLPDARRVSLPACGHLAFVTQPRRVAEEITRFLSETEKTEERAERS